MKENPYEVWYKIQINDLWSYDFGITSIYKSTRPNRGELEVDIALDALDQVDKVAQIDR